MTCILVVDVTPMEYFGGLLPYWLLSMYCKIIENDGRDFDFHSLEGPSGGGNIFPGDHCSVGPPHASTLYSIHNTLLYQYIRTHVRTLYVRVHNKTLNDCRIMLIVGDQDICFGVLMF